MPRPSARRPRRPPQSLRRQPGRSNGRAVVGRTAAAQSASLSRRAPLRCVSERHQDASLCAVWSLMGHAICRQNAVSVIVLCTGYTTGGLLPRCSRHDCRSYRQESSMSVDMQLPSPSESCHPRQAKPATVGAARRRVSIVSLIWFLLSTWPAVCASTPRARRSGGIMDQAIQNRVGEGRISQASCQCSTGS